MKIFAPIILLVASASAAELDIALLETEEAVASFIGAYDLTVILVEDPAHPDHLGHVEAFKHAQANNEKLHFGSIPIPTERSMQWSAVQNLLAEKPARGIVPATPAIQPPAIILVRRNDDGTLERQAYPSTPEYKLDNPDLVDLWILHKWASGLVTVTLDNSDSIFTSFTGKANFVILFESEDQQATPAQVDAVREAAHSYSHPTVASSIPKFLRVNKKILVAGDAKRGHGLFLGIVRRFLGMNVSDDVIAHDKFPLVAAIAADDFGEDSTVTPYNLIPTPAIGQAPKPMQPRPIEPEPLMKFLHEVFVPPYLVQARGEL